MDQHRRVVARVGPCIVFLLAAVACSAPQATESPGTELVGRNIGGLVLDYPASWAWFDHSVITSFADTLGYLGSVDVPDPCIRDPNSLSCQPAAYHLEPSTVVVVLGTIYRQAEPGGLEPAANERQIEVGGLPALVGEIEPRPETGAEMAVTWAIPMPGQPSAAYRITAEARGPGLQLLRAQLDAMVASIRFDPPLLTLPPEGALRDAAALSTLRDSIRMLRAEDPGFACFPLVPGARTTVVTRLPSTSSEIDPVAALCRSQIEATKIEMWKITLTLDAPGTAQDVDITQWVDPAGAMSEQVSGFGQ